MQRIFIHVASWLAALNARPPAPSPLDDLSLATRDWADLPTHHPRADDAAR